MTTSLHTQENVFPAEFEPVPPFTRGTTTWYGILWLFGYKELSNQIRFHSQVNFLKNKKEHRCESCPKAYFLYCFFFFWLCRPVNEIITVYSKWASTQNIVWSNKNKSHTYYSMQGWKYWKIQLKGKKIGFNIQETEKDFNHLVFVLDCRTQCDGQKDFFINSDSPVK